MTGLLCLTWNNHYSAFLKLLSNLHLKDLYCDATIACHGKYYPAHRLVLSTCSEYFEEIFSQTKCKHPYIIVKDVRPTELEALLNYMYKGEVNVSQESLPELIKAAEGLKIKGLAVPDEVIDKSPPSTNEGKRRNTTVSPSPQPKRKRHFEERRRRDSENSQSQSVTDNLNKHKRQLDTGPLSRSEQNDEDPRNPIHFKEENRPNLFNVNEIPVQLNDSSIENPLQEIKVEADALSNYSEELFSPQESNLNPKDGLSSSFLSPVSFTSSDASKKVPDDNPFALQANWGESSNKSEKELQLPLEVSYCRFLK
ncbi:UNVERIFIED_CONTAM: hypothetical protein GTU68_053923 [Idotea baltica]|nr:hypothetical protein [Idotea baltica]